MTDLVNNIVGNLEKKFDNIKDKFNSTANLGLTWKNDALNMTISEIPRIPLSGTERGLPRGFSDNIYAQADEIDKSKTVINLTLFLQFIC